MFVDVHIVERSLSRVLESSLFWSCALDKVHTSEILLWIKPSVLVLELEMLCCGKNWTLSYSAEVCAHYSTFGLHNVWGQKQSCPCYNARNVEQLHWNKIFCRVYCLVWMLYVARWTTYVPGRRVLEKVSTVSFCLGNGLFGRCNSD